MQALGAQLAANRAHLGKAPVRRVQVRHEQVRRRRVVGLQLDLAQLRVHRLRYAAIAALATAAEQRQPQRSACDAPRHALDKGERVGEAAGSGHGVHQRHQHAVGVAQRVVVLFAPQLLGRLRVARVTQRA